MFNGFRRGWRASQHARASSSSQDQHVLARSRTTRNAAIWGAGISSTFAVAMYLSTTYFTSAALPVAHADSPSSSGFTLPPLPFKKGDLAPFISEETVEYHYEKHHRGYVNKLNELTHGTPAADKTLEQLIASEAPGSKIYNLAAQIWNHSFYWKCMRPAATQGAANRPTGELAAAIDAQFGSFEEFRKQFTEAAVGHFGSGWAWLMRDVTTNRLQIVTTHDAGCPIVDPKRVPLLTCDVWEHAYYIDTRNDRGKYVNNWWSVVNWEYAGSRYSKKRA